MRYPALLSALVLCLSACSAEPAREQADDQASAPLLADSLVVTRGAAASNRLAAGLIAPLTAAVEQHGTAGAIDFCSREALRLTAAVQDSIGDGIALQRVTLKYRNPQNAPDSLDRAVLQELEDALQRGDTLPAFVLRRQGETARYYRPLRVQPLCLKCHGEDAALEQDVRTILQQRYPQDAARGYREGDLRGAIRVTFSPAL